MSTKLNKLSIISTPENTDVTIRSTDKKGKESTVRIEKISNGYILIEEIYNPGNGKNISSSWKTTKTYYEKNPLLKEDNRTVAEIIKSISK